MGNMAYSKASLEYMLQKLPPHLNCSTSTDTYILLTFDTPSGVNQLQGRFEDNLLWSFPNSSKGETKTDCDFCWPCQSLECYPMRLATFSTFLFSCAVSQCRKCIIFIAMLKNPTKNPQKQKPN